MLALRLIDVLERLVRGDAGDVALVALHARQRERVVLALGRLVGAVHLDPFGEAELFEI